MSSRQSRRGGLIAGRAASLELGPEIFRNLARQIAHLVRQAALPQRERETALDRSDDGGRTVASMPLPLSLDDIDRAAEVHWTSGTAVGTPWDEFRGRFFPLPDWFDHQLDPFSEAYAAQQDRLWRLIAGRDGPYSPELNEQTPDISGLEPLVRPGFYLLPPHVAGDHLIAMGHFLKHSNVSAGDRVLEYGAGFAQNAIAFARLGAIVDTVDISPEFCQAVKAQAEWFNVPVTAFHGRFGINPRPGERYKLVIFYESFHHCRAFLELICNLKEIVALNGKILLAGEPIEASNTPQIPFPWGIRLDAENVAVVRKRGWFEIGFQESFFLKCFITRGFVYRKHPGVISHFATIYEFQHKPAIINLTTWDLLPSDRDTWHEIDPGGNYPGGRWTTARSVMTLDDSDPAPEIGVRVTNYHDRPRRVRFTVGDAEEEVSLEHNESKEVLIARIGFGSPLIIECDTICAREYGGSDERDLGIFVEQVRYVPAGG